ncbi:DUF3993 domain-containing protein [Bacillus manliponensis]
MKEGANVKRYGILVVLFLCVVFMIGQSITTVLGKEEGEVNREEIFATIQKGYEAQFSIRNKGLSMDQMYDKLSSYFTDNFLQVFTDENSTNAKQSGEYLFPTREAPFSFQAETKVVQDKKYGLLYVYEKNKNERYQIVTLQKEGEKWKIAGYHESKQLFLEIQKLQK